jgi:hypothetical protein
MIEMGIEFVCGARNHDVKPHSPIGQRLGGNGERVSIHILLPAGFQLAEGARSPADAPAGHAKNDDQQKGSRFHRAHTRCGPGYIPIDRAFDEQDINLNDWAWTPPGSEAVMKTAIREVLK